MAVFRVPVIYDAVTRQVRPAGVGDAIDPAYFFLNSSQLVYQDQSNALRIRDGQLYYSAVSSDAGNYIKLGQDGAPFLDGNTILSNGGNGAPNLLSIDATDNKIVLTLEVLTNYGVATKTTLDEAYTRMKMYIDTTFVTLESFPAKVAALTSHFVTTQEFDSLRLRVTELERTVKSLEDTLSALSLHVETELTALSKKITTEITALSTKVTSDITTAKNEALEATASLATKVTKDITAAKNEALTEISTLSNSVTDELYAIYDTFPSYTLLTTTNDLRTRNSLEHSLVGVAGQIASTSAIASSKLKALSSEYSNDLRSVLSGVNASSVDAVTNLQTLSPIEQE